jgi:hypothetical protein
MSINAARLAQLIGQIAPLEKEPSQDLALLEVGAPVMGCFGARGAM